jgi:hypothetical protein
VLNAENGAGRKPPMFQEDGIMRKSQACPRGAVPLHIRGNITTIVVPNDNTGVGVQHHERRRESLPGWDELIHAPLRYANLIPPRETKKPDITGDGYRHFIGKAARESSEIKT